MISRSAPGSRPGGCRSRAHRLAAAVAVCRTRPTAALLTAITLTAIHGNFVFAMPVLSYHAACGPAAPNPSCGDSPPPSPAASCCPSPAASPSPPGSLHRLARPPRRPALARRPLLAPAPGTPARGWERAERLEHQQRIIAERERLRERARIAQDMHDSSATNSPSSPSAQAPSRSPPDSTPGTATPPPNCAPAPPTPPTASARSSASSAKTPAPAPARGGPAAPARETIPDLVDRARASGVPVHLTGTPPDLPPMPALTAHRVVQEAITNAAKHAPAPPSPSPSPAPPTTAPSP